MTASIPAPLVPADVDCTDLDGFMLNVERLMASELVALSSHEVIGAALLLWCRAWKQRPAASLPNDEKVIAAFARMPLARFRRISDEVLRGFVLCDDGRLYHSTLAREAINAYGRKVSFQRRREADAERLRKWRSGTRTETPPETPDETRFVAEGQGQGQGQGQGHEIQIQTASQLAESPASPPTPPPAFAGDANLKALNGRSVVALADAWELPLQWGLDAESLGWQPPAVVKESERFRQYWTSGNGKGQRRSVKGWRQCWSNWLAKAERMR
jgi:uncharacterized protein YdaU (DUF1376 family)